MAVDILGPDIKVPSGISIGNPTVEIRRSWDRLIPTIGFPILVKWHLYNEPPLQWRHNERDGVSNHRHLGGLLNRLLRRRSKKTSKLCLTGLCEGTWPVTGEFPSQRASNAENVFIWWRHHDPPGSLHRQIIIGHGKTMHDNIYIYIYVNIY